MKHYKIKLKFFGKDSVPYEGEIEVSKEIWEQYNLLSQKNGEIFSVTSGDVKNYLRKISGFDFITPKMCRTAVCNKILVEELKKQNVTKDSTEAQKIRAIFNANLAIAKKLNHQKNVGKNQREQEAKTKERVEKTKERIKELKEKHRQKIILLNEKAKKYREAFKGQKLLKEKLQEIEEAKIKLTTQMERAKLAFEKAEFAQDKKKLTKDVALGTSLSAYASPMVLYSYLKWVNLPIEKIYTAGLRKNFTWAESVDENYWMNYPS